MENAAGPPGLIGTFAPELRIQRRVDGPAGVLSTTMGFVRGNWSLSLGRVIQELGAGSERHVATLSEVSLFPQRASCLQKKKN